MGSLTFWMAAVAWTALSIAVAVALREILSFVGDKRWLRRRTFFSTDVELNRFVLAGEGKSFVQGWPAKFGRIFGRSSIIVVSGDDHRRHRSNFLGFLTSARLQTSFLRHAESTAAAVLCSWSEKGATGAVVYFKRESQKFTFSFIVNEILNISIGDPTTEFLRENYEFFLSGLIAKPINLPGTRFYKALKARGNIERVVREKVEEKKKKNLAEIEEESFLVWLLKTTDYTTEEIVDQVITMLFAGFDTTSKALPAAVYFLMNSPEAYKKLMEEHLDVVSSRETAEQTTLSLIDYKKMDFTQCVIMETLRLANISSTLQKLSVKDVNFKDYSFPKGTIIQVSNFSVHMNPSFFEDPDTFNPWRWMSSSGVKRSNNLMPFGGGARHCVGSEIAKMELAVFLHQLIVEYDFEPVEPDHPVRVPHLDFFKDLPIRVRRRVAR